MSGNAAAAAAPGSSEQHTREQRVDEVRDIGRLVLPDTVRFVERDWLSSNQVFLVDGADATVVDTGYVKHAPMTVAIVGRLLAESRTRLARIV
ncbi:MAG: hypothetical protein ACLGHY_11980, partial [Gammaproteobacteria bacterium]